MAGKKNNCKFWDIDCQYKFDCVPCLLAQIVDELSGYELRSLHRK